MPDDYYKEDVVSLDADLENADWTKQSWDLPPYRSAEFMAQVQDIEAFKQSPVYKNAVDQGLIIDDEWAADHIQPVATGD
jgi:hypothetical protein